MSDEDQNKNQEEQQVETQDQPVDATENSTHIEEPIVEEPQQEEVAETAQTDDVTPEEMQPEQAEELPAEEQLNQPEETTDSTTTQTEEVESAPIVESEEKEEAIPGTSTDPNAKWYVVHTYSGHENKVSNALKQRIESEHLESKIFDILVPTQDKIEIRSGKKEQVKEKIFPGYILVKMILDDNSWLAVRTTPGVTAFVGIGNKPTPISEKEVRSIVQFMSQGAAPTFKDVFLPDDTVKIVDGPFAEFIGKVDSVDKEKGKVRVLVSIFGRETPVELDFLQVQKL